MVVVETCNMSAMSLTLKSNERSKRSCSSGISIVGLPRNDLERCSNRFSSSSEIKMAARSCNITSASLGGKRSATNSGGSRNKAMGGGGYIGGAAYFGARSFPPPPPGLRLPKARIIKFMNFNAGICSPYSFRQRGGGGGVRNYIERSSMATDLNFSGCHYIN